MKLSFGSDRAVVRGPRQDGALSVTFYTGEYEQDKVAQILCIPQNTPLKVTVEIKQPGTVNVSEKYNFKKGANGEKV